MAHSTKILLGAAAVGVATWLLLSLDRDPAPTPPARTTVQLRAEAASATARDGAPVASEREAAAAPGDSPAVDLTHAFAYEIECRVVDRDGLIVPHAVVAVAPCDGRLNRWSEPAGTDGVVTVRWQAKVPHMEVALGLVLNGHAVVLQRAHLDAGRPTNVTMLDATGGSAGMCMSGMQSSAQQCNTCHRSNLMPHLFDAALTMRRGLHPDASFGDFLVGDTGERSGNPPTGPDLRLVTPKPSRAATSKATTVSGIVRDQNGAPVAGEAVVWSRLPDIADGRTKTGADGSYTLSHVAPGAIEIRAGGAEHGIARTTVQVALDQQHSCELFLQPGRRLTGRVLLPAGLSADDWRIEYATTDGNWADGCLVKPDSTFALANLPSETGSVLLWSSQPHRLPAAFEALAATGSELVFDLRQSGVPTGSLRVQPLAPGEMPPATPAISRLGPPSAAEIQLDLDHPPATQPAHDTQVDNTIMAWQLQTGRGTTVPRGRRGIYVLDGLPAGFYRVAMTGPGVGVVDLGEHWVDGKSQVDLGNPRLPAPAHLRLASREPAPNLEFYQRRRDLDLRGEVVLPNQSGFLLPAGDWLMMWGSEDAPKIRTFTTVPDQLLELSLE